MSYGEFAKIYDKLINEDIDYDKIANRINEVISKLDIKKEDYLDLACGTGNVSIKICSEFDNIYLVDLSEDMLSEADEKFRGNNNYPMIICQDMVNLELNHRFDLITCMLDSTNYLIEDGELQKYFNNIYNHLKEDGIFIFDINSYYKISNILGNNIYIHNEDNIFYSWENEFEDDVVGMFLTFFVKDGDKYEKFEEEHYERGYTEFEIEEALKNAGLKLVSKYDEYTKNQVNEKSERIMYVVKKA